MKWILIFIALTSNGHVSKQVKEYTSLTDCFEARELLVKHIGRPIIDYQAICVPRGIPNK